MPQRIRTLPGFDQDWTQCPTLDVVGRAFMFYVAMSFFVLFSSRVPADSYGCWAFPRVAGGSLLYRVLLVTPCRIGWRQDWACVGHDPLVGIPWRGSLHFLPRGGCRGRTSLPAWPCFKGQKLFVVK